MITYLLLTVCCLIALSHRSLQRRRLFSRCLQHLHTHCDGPKARSGVPSEGVEECGEEAVGFRVPTADAKLSLGLIKPSNPSLPVEVIERISDFLFEIKLPIPDCTGNTSITCSKPVWSEVESFMRASVDLHNMGFTRWLCVITVKERKDWEIILQNMRVVRCCLHHFPSIQVAVFP